MLFTFLVAFNFFHIIFAYCPNGSIASLSNPPKCYYFESQKQNWVSAEETCKAAGGDLASIHDMFDNMFISGEAASNFTDSVSADFWIGGNNLYQPGIWSWIDGTLFDFTDWDIGQPQNNTGSNCVAVKMQGGQWISDDCYKLKPFACVVHDSFASISTTPSKPKTCPLSWTSYNGFCYKVFENATWIDAEDRCKVDDAHLASIHSLEEASFVAKLAHYPGVNGCDWRTQAWIGLFSEDSYAHWNWTDKTLFDFSNWMPTGAPTGTTLDYGFIYLSPCSSPYIADTGNFDNAYGNEIMPRFICKKSPE